MKRASSLLLLCFLLLTHASAQEAFDISRLLAAVEVLAADSLEGRRVGTTGNEKARAYIRAAFERYHLLPPGEGYEHTFQMRSRGSDSLRGVNLLGYVPGTEHTDTYIVITAHYDHLGRRNGTVYNGADDNASGVAGLLALADYFSRHRPRHSILFAALDAEESGLQGARALVLNPPVSSDQMALNVNLDMISRNEKQELFVAGTFHYPFLKPVLERVAERSRIHLRFGHDEPRGASGQDWTSSSDHGAFHLAGIPFLYFGVEDHADYHRATDDFENIDPDFFVRAVETILDAVRELDTHLEALLEDTGP